MFLKNSRYAAVPTAQVASPRDAESEVSVVKIRRLPVPSAATYVVKGSDQLDALSEARFQDATRYWHVADANSEIEAEALMHPAARAIEMPES